MIDVLLSRSRCRNCNRIMTPTRLIAYLADVVRSKFLSTQSCMVIPSVPQRSRGIYSPLNSNRSLDKLGMTYGNANNGWAHYRGNI